MRIYRICYVVCFPGTDWPRRIPMTLPKDGSELDPAEVEAEGGVVVRLESGADLPDPEALCRRLAARPAENREKRCLVLAAPDVPAGDVIRTLAAFSRADHWSVCAWPSPEEER